MSREQSFKGQKIKAVILVASRDFGRCPLASRLPTALWPVGDKPALERLLLYLSRQGIKQAVVCCNGDAPLLRGSIAGTHHLQLKFLDEPLPVGTAGCIRDAADGEASTLFLVLQAAMTSPPNIKGLIRKHQHSKSDLTVVFEPKLGTSRADERTAQIYVCEPAVLEYIPKAGYYDIKESLIPAMLRAGKTTHMAVLNQPVGSFRDRTEYLSAIASCLENRGNTITDFSAHNWNKAKNVWLARSANIEPSARIYGPVVVMDGAVVSQRAIIFGSTIVGPNVVIGKNTLVENSVFWERSSVGQNCEIRSCIIDYNAVVPNGTVAEDQAVTYKQNGKLENGANKALSLVNGKANQLLSAAWPPLYRINAKLPAWVRSAGLRSNILRWAGISILAGVFLWSYWPQLVDLWNIWQKSDEYSSGLLVPFLALYILWVRRREIAPISTRYSIWGLFAFVAAQALRYFGLFFMYSSAERLSLVLSIASLALLLFGWQVFRKISSVLLFLCLMLPLPRSVHTAVMLPLQRLATISAVFCLEMMGYPVIREGNIIHLNDTTMAMAEACSGLRLVTSFFVITGLVALLIRRTWWEKLIVLLSALPIALLCNTVRLTITAIVFTRLTGQTWERIFHDFGGYAMMPLALAILIFELWLLTKLTTVTEEKNDE